MLRPHFNLFLAALSIDIVPFPQVIYFPYCLIKLDGRIGSCVTRGKKLACYIVFCSPLFLLKWSSKDIIHTLKWHHILPYS